MDKQKAMFEEIKKKIREKRPVPKLETTFSNVSNERLIEICADVAESRLSGKCPKSLVPYAQDICDMVNEPDDIRLTFQDGMESAENELLMEFNSRRTA